MTALVMVISLFLVISSVMVISMGEGIGRGTRVLSLSLLKMPLRWASSSTIQRQGPWGGFRKRRQNSVTSLPELLGIGRRLGDRSASITFAFGPAGAASLIYASAAMMAATSETATAGPIVFGDFMGAPLLPARGTVVRRNGFIQCRVGRPSGPTQWTSGLDAAGEIRNSVWTCI